MHVLPGFVGSGSQLAKIAKNVCAVAPSSLAILVVGESGTGKERVARAIHQLSRRKGKFVTIDCGALPPTLVEEELFGHEKGSFTGANDRRPGLLEVAHEGTVFLDEVAELPLSLQPRLLRVLQEHSLRRIGAREETAIDLRFVSATNANLLQQVSEKAFRADLYFRLAGFTVQLPPLRERRGDIPQLVDHFLEVFHARERQFDREAMRFLCSYDWPGNVRELENFVQRMICLVPDRLITKDAVCQHLGGEVKVSPEATTLAEAEYQTIQRALSACDGNVSMAAERLGLARSTLYSYLKKRREDEPRPTPMTAEVVLRERRVIKVSEKACELIGYKPNELLGRTPQDFSDLSQAARDEIYHRWKQHGSLTGLYVLRHRSGARVEVMFEATTLPNGDCHVRWLPLENG